ncbi:MAG TPA: bifunctional UDP-sugar hydrolase/5'-nucleotidase [Bacteroidales bacterium]|nr:bifunctional UDP-sugar hydrolase/5'-nucleotidase [Bacteroidales bacterium]HPT10398.1 bifunctional UDP-sugar hydrolase/5'-nucleotidase [Bacteroidales bacterium]
MKVNVNGKSIRIFSGSTAGDAILMYSEFSFRRVMSGDLVIRDRYGNEIDPGGAISPETQLFIKKKQNKMKRYLIFCATFLMMLSASCAYSQDGDSNQPLEVILLHTNDMHSKIDNLPQLAYLADSLRKTHKKVFLVVAGDNFTGNPVVDMIPDKGAPMIELMNRAGVDLSCLGNHEFDLGQELLNKRIGQASFPFICANLNCTEATLSQPKPYALLEVAPGINLAFLGLIQRDENGLPSSLPANMTGIRFFDELSTALKFRWIKEQYGNMIILSHLGLDADIRLAESFPQADLIIGGHSHTLMEKPIIQNGVTIVQAGSNLKYVGKTTLTMENNAITTISDEVIPLAKIGKGNPEMEKLVAQYNDNEVFKQVVATTTSRIEGVDQLGSMMTDALTSELKVDFAFQNRGGIRIQAIEAGDITLKDIYKLDPFNNPVIIYRMNAEEIRSLICNSYDVKSGIDLQVSGLTYTLSGDAKHPCTVVMKLSNGKKLNPEKEYTVALNSYIASTYRFDHRDPGKASGLYTADALVSWLKNKKSVNYNGIKRASVKP